MRPRPFNRTSYDSEPNKPEQRDGPEVEKVIGAYKNRIDCMEEAKRIANEAHQPNE